MRAWNASDLAGVVAKGKDMVQSVLDIDELLSSQAGFLMGAWITQVAPAPLMPRCRARAVSTQTFASPPSLVGCRAHTLSCTRSQSCACRAAVNVAAAAKRSTQARSLVLWLCGLDHYTLGGALATKRTKPATMPHSPCSCFDSNGQARRTLVCA